MLTDHTVRIDQVLAWNLRPKDEVVVIQFGGQTEFRWAVATEGLPLFLGTSGIFFLVPANDLVGDTFDGKRYYMRGVWAGFLRFAGNQAEISNAASNSLKQDVAVGRSAVISKLEALAGAAKEKGAK